jgi:hypothetical protein
MKVRASFKMAMLALSVIAITIMSCTGDDHDMETLTESVPTYYYPSQDNSKLIVYDQKQNEMDKMPNPFNLVAEDTIRVSGNQNITPASSLTQEVSNDTIEYLYSYSIVNKVTVKGYPVTYKNQTLRPLKGVLNLIGSRAVIKVVQEPYYEKSKTSYSLILDDYTLASADQYFVVEEGIQLKAFNWSYKHLSYNREAKYGESIATVLCNNRAVGTKMYNTGKKEQDTCFYNVDNKFAVTVSAATVDNLSTVVGTTVAVASDGSATVSGAEFLKISWLSANVSDNVMLNGTNYRDSIAPCVVKAQTVKINSASSATVRFYEDGKADDYAELNISVSLREKEAEKPYVVSTAFSYYHVEVDRVGSLSGSTATVHCSNRAVVTSKWSDKSETTEATNYNVDNNFRLYLSEIVVADVNDVIGTRYSFTNGSVTVGNAVLRAIWNSASVTDAAVEIGNKDYKGQIIPCKLVAHSIFINSVSRATLRFCEEENSADYADVEVSISMYEETPSWSTKHNSWTSASLSGSSILVNCSNTASFKYSVNTANNENVAYTCQNVFNWSGLTMEVESLNNVVGKTFTFNNGVATIEGTAAKCTFVSAAVSSDVYHRGTNYKSQIEACVAEAISITFNSATSATILLGEGSDNAGVTVPVTVTEKKVITVTDIIRNFVHSAYRSNVEVSGNTISITCDNVASFVKKFSDNTQSDATNVAYTVVNKFLVDMPTFVGAQPTGTYSFFNGEATVAGKNVVITFDSRTTSSIVYEGKDYKSEAPVCKVTANTVTFKDGSADIIFTDGNENITVTVPVTVISAEAIPGTILNCWVTDSYKGRIYDSSYIHILTEEGKVYSRLNQSKNEWTVRTLTSSEMSVAKEQALAYYWYQNVWCLGYVKPIAYSEGSKEKYILQYFDFSGALANNLGKAEATLNGQDFAYPIRPAEYDATTGIWSIENQYFVSSK